MESTPQPEVVTTDTQELIVVKTLPEIVGKFMTIKDELKNILDYVKSLPCNTNTVGEIKKVRSALRKRFEAYEDQRKAVKKAILAPYDAVEAAYDSCLATPFAEIDETLKRQIALVEDAIKQEKAMTVILYFNELCAAAGIDFLRFEQTNIRVGLSDTEPALRKAAKAFVENVQTDMQLIASQEHAEEIMVEYKDCLNAASAILKVNNRHKALEAEKERIAQNRAAEQSPMVQKVEAIVAESAPKRYEDRGYVTFRVYGKLAMIESLKIFIEKCGFTYEQIQEV